MAPPFHSNLTKYAWLSVAAAVTTIALKGTAYFLTSSVGLLSDALESIVNLVAALVAVVMLRVSAAPPDDDHEFGHDKAEYFSSGLEGALIFVAALSIVVTAVPRLLHPQPVESAVVGLTVSMVATGVNFAVSRVLVRAGHRERSIALEADGHHLMTDVWTSLGVVCGVGLVALTGWTRLDPIVAIAVALHILGTGYGLIRRSAMGLLDATILPEERAEIVRILDSFKSEGIVWHALKTRQAGMRRFASVHVLVPGDWTVHRGHDVLERIEKEVTRALPGTMIFTHLEPVEDARAWDDEALPPRSNDPGREEPAP